jgi:beta-glucosidase
VAASGIEWTFAPTLAVPQDLRWGRSYEGYSTDPKQVAAYAKAMILGLQGPLVSGSPLAGNHIAATAKHFIADGGTQGGKDQGDAIISEAELVRLHAPGYPAAIDAGALTVMTSFSSWNGLKNHGNRSLMTDVLKGKMGFDGFIVGDWNAHGQIAGCTVTDCAAAINAGLDMYMAPDSWKGLFDSLLREVRSGEVPMARLDDAVRRILRVKIKLGLLDNDRPVTREYSVLGAPEHLALAREAVAKSLVLLKNNGSVLPIKPGTKVLVAGDGADDMSKQAGGWTITWQGKEVTRKDFPGGRSVWQGIDAAVRDAGGSTQLSSNGQFTDKPDVAIIVYGEEPYAEFQGDVPTLDYQPNDASNLAIINNLKKIGIPVVSVFLSGRPMFVNPEINASNAFVAAWLPGSQGDGIADVLVAGKDGKPKRGFTGKLSFPWPSDARSPVVKPVFAAGYGLTYGQRRNVGMLNENPRIDVAAALNIDRYFERGLARAPWTMSISDAGGSRIVNTGKVVTPLSNLSVRSVDLAAQEDAKRLDWTGRASVSIDGPPADLTRPLTVSFALRLDWRIEAKSKGGVTLAFGDRAVDISQMIQALPVGELSNIRVPLQCFADQGMDIAHVGTPFRLTADAGFSTTLLSAKIEPVGDKLSCPPAAK